jgi:hypothetical protein
LLLGRLLLGCWAAGMLAGLLGCWAGFDRSKQSKYGRTAKRAREAKLQARFSFVPVLPACLPSPAHLQHRPKHLLLRPIASHPHSPRVPPSSESFSPKYHRLSAPSNAHCLCQALSHLLSRCQRSLAIRLPIAALWPFPSPPGYLLPSTTSKSPPTLISFHHPQFPSLIRIAASLTFLASLVRISSLPNSIN